MDFGCGSGRDTKKFEDLNLQKKFHTVEERLEAIQNMLDLGLTKEQILKKYSLEEYEKALYSMPTKV